jgi:hypothetical protein
MWPLVRRDLSLMIVCEMYFTVISSLNVNKKTHTQENKGKEKNGCFKAVRDLDTCGAPVLLTNQINKLNIM